MYFDKTSLPFTWKSTSMPGVRNLSLTIYPFSISTNEHVLLKFLTTKRLSETTKIH